MKNHLSTRLISATSLGILGFLFFYSGTSLVFFSMAICIVYSLLGYFHGYKILLLPADHLNAFPLRCVAGVWLGSLSYFIAMGINSFFIDAPKTNGAIFIGLAVFAFLIGWLFLYRALLFPRVTYLKLFPSLTQRVISAIWFGIIGYMLAVIVLKQVISMMSIFVLLLAAYLGFAYGYRILLLPTSIRGVVKSIIIGFIGNSYALFIVFLLIISSDLPELFSPNFHIGQTVGSSFVLIFVIFPLMSLFICGTGIVFSLLLYFISRLWAYKGTRLNNVG